MNTVQSGVGQCDEDILPDSEQSRNPIQIEDVSDDDRGEMLREYLDALEAVCPDARLMPLGDEGKAPAIEDQCRLGSDEAQAMLHTREEAIDAIRDGANGFVLYAGRPEHGTDDLVLVDHDDMDAFPLDTLPDTLTVMSGSGRGYHETFENVGDVRNAQGTGEMKDAGEVRASNWYCVLPGSIHPSGGIYHVTENREIAELCSDDLPEGLQPSTSRYDASDTIEIRRDPDRTQTDDVNAKGMSLDELRDYDWKLDSLLSTDYPEWIGHNDDSRIDATLVWRLRYHHFEPSEIADIWQQYRWRDKLERDDYIQRTVQKCASHDDRARYDREVEDIEATLSETPSFTERDIESEAGDVETELSLSRVHERCQDRIEHAIRHGDRVLIDALPSLGKSHGLVRAIAETGGLATILTARHDLYEQYRDWCSDVSLDYYTLPAFHRECPTARGDHGKDWQEKVLALYDAGVTPKKIHRHASDRFGHPLPCAGDGACPYSSKWSFEADNYDVLIGHYSHAYNETLTTDRVVAFDESPTDAFLTELDGDTVGRSVSAYLDRIGGIPFDDYTDLLEYRDHRDRRTSAIEWFEEHGIERDAEAVLADETGRSHALAPLMTYALLVGENLENGWEHTAIDSGFDSDSDSDSNRGAVAARSRDAGTLTLLLPPPLEDADSVIALDGTPTHTLWELTLGVDLEHRQVLDDDERTRFLSNTLGHQIIQTTDAIKPYSSRQGLSLTPDYDGDLFEVIRAREGRKPALISTRQALNRYEDAGVLDPIGEREHYGNLKGSNQFETERVGIVAGSRHFGDEYVRKWGALAGEAIEPLTGDDGERLRGTEHGYEGELGTALLHHMRENEVLQALLRFGRDGGGANVYVHTSAIPDWVPVQEAEVTPWSDGMREVITALRESDQDAWTTADIGSDAHVSISERQIRTHLKRLADYGYLDRETEERGYRWIDAALDDVNEHGRVAVRQT